MRDYGIGFDMSYRDKPLLAVQRLHANDVQEGSGLGLAAARRIVVRHGGTNAAGCTAFHANPIGFVDSSHIIA